MKTTALQAFGLPVILMGMIFLLSSIPGDVEGGVLKVITTLEPSLQNLLHIPLFGLLQFLWLRGFASRGTTGAAAIAASFCITLSYGALDELHQYFVPGRYASLLDLGLNLLGVVLGTLVFWLVTQTDLGRKIIGR